MSGVKHTPSLCNKEELEKLSDEELVKICVIELPETLHAYRILMQRYEGLIYNTCRKMLGNAEDAEEITQDTFIQLFHKLHQFKGLSSFKTWLYKIVQNYCKNRIAKQIRHRKGKEKLIEYNTHFVSEFDSSSSKNEQSDYIKKVLETLKEKEREIIILKFVSGLTIEEISGVLNLGLSAAKMRLYRALDSFKLAYERFDSTTHSSS